MKKKTLIMGILNVTPDSFSDGGLYFNNTKKALHRVEEMVKEGADIIDIGGESTRPGSTPISVTEELKRVLPVIRAVRKRFNQYIRVSVDTYKAKVAEACLKAGADMVNSLGGFSFDSNLVKVIAKYRSPMVLYHIKGEPKTMQSYPIRYDDVVAEIKKFFRHEIDYAVKRGVKKDTLILDPGIGFGKTVEHNLQIIRRFEAFKTFSLPLMVGVSRKSHLGIILKESMNLKEMLKAEERIEAGLAEAAVAVLKGANIIRTHDVLAAKKFLSVLDKLT